MSGLIHELIDVLAQQTELCGELLALSDEKKDAVVKNDISELQKITSLENILIGKNQKLENKRVVLFKDLAMVLNKKEQELTISVLAETVKERPEHDELLEKAAALKQTLQKLKEVNERNRELIQASLDYIDFSVNVMRSSMDTDPVLYSKRGDIIENGKGFFDARQ